MNRSVQALVPVAVGKSSLVLRSGRLASTYAAAGAMLLWRSFHLLQRTYRSLWSGPRPTAE